MLTLTNCTPCYLVCLAISLVLTVQLNKDYANITASTIKSIKSNVRLYLQIKAMIESILHLRCQIKNKNKTNNKKYVTSGVSLTGLISAILLLFVADPKLRKPTFKSWNKNWLVLSSIKQSKSSRKSKRCRLVMRKRKSRMEKPMIWIAYQKTRWENDFLKPPALRQDKPFIFIPLRNGQH